VVAQWQALQRLAIEGGAAEADAIESVTVETDPDMTAVGEPYPLDLRTAALTLGVERLARVTAQRGIWP
ncbi:MAG: hypothetical protein KUG71_00735, partial [Porticoccaceae bacterium]|nr:hypothetical protein [Porticoccaceae bacterium]